jgi:hypothetical protein
MDAKARGRKDWKPAWQWRLSGTRAVSFLIDIFPWLVIKRDQALTAMTWDAARPGSGGRWDHETLDLLVEQMKWLNQKGPRLGREEPIKRVLREEKTGQSELVV